MERKISNAMEISDHSPFSGMLFCTGTFAEMSGPDGTGEDLVEAIHEFESRGHIFQVHFRYVSSTLPDFHEPYPDNGYLNMYCLFDRNSDMMFRFHKNTQMFRSDDDQLLQVSIPVDAEMIVVYSDYYTNQLSWISNHTIHRCYGKIH